MGFVVGRYGGCEGSFASEPTYQMQWVWYIALYVTSNTVLAVRERENRVSDQQVGGRN